MLMKNAVISLGIEPTIFQLVGQCLNQLRHRAPLPWKVTLFKTPSEKHSVIYKFDVEVSVPRDKFL